MNAETPITTYFTVSLLGGTGFAGSGFVGFGGFVVFGGFVPFGGSVDLTTGQLMLSKDAFPIVEFRISISGRLM